MATRSRLWHMFRLAGSVLAAGVLAASSIVLPPSPLEASTSVASDFGAPRDAPRSDHPSSPAADPGIIAYGDRTAANIHLIAPDGTGDRVLWTYPAAEVHWLEIDLAWRPDGRELAFTSEHESACSWFESDIYAIRYDGKGYRRITNSPACAALAALPQGAVTVSVTNYTSDMVWAYVAGAPSVKSILGSGVVTFDKVADFGPGVKQPSIGIWGLTRFVSYPPYADVEQGKTLPGGQITIMQYSGFRSFGAGKISWRADSSALAYVLRSNTDLWQISTSPAYGDTGQALPINQHTSAALVAWGPTAATQNQYLYYSGPNLLDEGYKGIWLNTVGNTSGGERLVAFDDSDAARVYDIEWLPDGSGFLCSVFYVGLGYFADIFRYDFGTGALTQLTHFPKDVDFVRGLSISPDGRQVVFEREADELNSDSSVWLMNIDGSNVRMFVDHAGRPAWGRTAVVLPTVSTYMPSLVRGAR